MPELPDLVYITEALNAVLPGRKIRAVEVREPVVLRVLIPGSGGIAAALSGERFQTVERQGPFLKLQLEHLEIIVHFMLSGRFQLQQPGQRRVGHFCFSLALDNGPALNYGDDKRMGKVYLLQNDEYDRIPGYLDQGVDVLSKAFTEALFRGLISKKRCQSRVFIMDQSCLSAIGNAYADEILFQAGIHPKTLCSQLDDKEVGRLYRSVVDTLRWGIDSVRRAGRPLEIKVRDHLRVRNRKGQACSRCGTTIRRVGVLGYDSFFCPRCQPARKGQTVPW